MGYVLSRIIQRFVRVRSGGDGEAVSECAVDIAPGVAVQATQNPPLWITKKK